MALTSGFFNSISGDRTYNADQISSMFEGLISDGIYESVGDAYIVTASSGMVVNVGTGRAMLMSKWVKNTAPIGVTISAAHVLLPRYTAVVLRLDISNREITVTTIDGTAASTPSKPAIVRNNSYYDLLLAYVYVPAGATAISQANIEDQRANTTYCGWVTGIITQVDTSQLFLQWQTAYEEFYETTTAAFEEWFDDLTEKLQVNTYITQYEKHVELAASDSRNITLNDYTVEGGEVYMIYFNGLEAVQGVDWTLSSSGNSPVIHVNMGGTGTQEVDIKILKSKIGDPVMQPSTHVVPSIDSIAPIETLITIE